MVKIRAICFQWFFGPNFDEIFWEKIKIFFYDNDTLRKVYFYLFTYLKFRIIM